MYYSGEYYCVISEIHTVIIKRIFLFRCDIIPGHGADGQLSIGKEVWLLHSKLNAGVHKETVDVLCYSNGRSDHLEVSLQAFCMVC